MALTGIDTAVVAALQEVGGDPLVNQLFELFLEYTPTRLQGIRDAIEAENSEELAYWAHSLRSGAASIGARDLASRAAALELLAERRADGVAVPRGSESLLERTAERHEDLLSCFAELEQILRGHLVDSQRQEVRFA